MISLSFKSESVHKEGCVKENVKVTELQKEKKSANTLTHKLESF